MRRVNWMLMACAIAAALTVARTATAAFDTPITIVGLPDTQYYTSQQRGGTPAMFEAQTQWIVNNIASHNIAFVTHYGDITDHGGTSSQWPPALSALNRLHAGGNPANPALVPYAVLPGNHDLYGDNGANYLNYLGRSRFANEPWYKGASPNGLSSYQKFSAGNQEFLHLALEYNPQGSINDPATTIGWAYQVLRQNPATPTIITTHSYLGINNNGRTSIGQTIYNTLVFPNDQVFLVMNGHDHGEGRQVSYTAGGFPVYEIMADYQDDPNGGNGYMRLIRLDPRSNTLSVGALSPYLASQWPTPIDGGYRQGGQTPFSYTVNFADRFNLTNPPPPPPPPPPPGSTLMGHWKLDETSGTVAADCSGRGYNGVVRNATNPMWSANGAVGGCLLLDGVDDYVQLEGSPTSNPPGTLGAAQFTLAAWIKRTGRGRDANTGSGGIRAEPIFAKLIGQAEGSNVDGNYFMGLVVDAQGRARLAADLEQGATGAKPGQNHPITGNTVIPNDVWTHVAVTYDGTSWKLYVNGELDATLTVGQPPRSDSIQWAALGAALDSSGGGGADGTRGAFKGYLDDVRLYSAALSQADIQRLMNPVPLPAPVLIGLAGISTVVLARGRARRAGR